MYIHRLSVQSVRRLITQYPRTLTRSEMANVPEQIVRRGGISRTVFITSLVIVAAAAGLSGYFVNGILHPPPGTITLNGEGSTFVNPLLTAMNANYTRANP